MQPIFRAGACVYHSPTATEARHRAREQQALFDPRLFQDDNPYTYPVGREHRLSALRHHLIAAARAPQA